ncbi:hypothetical protein [Saccharopolyspora dendranthemae]|uniref:Uncharacterized protein n=1 Tax=Saccharopolyspora dendranthemae TaxID=1181886 RepID=A0A561U8B5_9PSEU|nr:hypothetical protein [Saccharopolyspora dendranthemae]TWF95577.1 hypothetical protein FHU35_12574 [Saccharopolyspora dendranthemae]
MRKLQPVCACLCSAAGHHGICQETPAPGCLAPAGWLTSIPKGDLCRACFAAAHQRLAPVTEPQRAPVTT